MQENLENGIEGFRVRFAQEEDSAELFAMVRELAEYEKLLGCFEATEQLMRKALFERHIAEALIAEFKGKLWVTRFSSTIFQLLLGDPASISKTST